MNDDKQFSELTSQLADIELPTEPEWWPVYLFAVVALSILLSAIQLIRLRYQRVNTKQIQDVTQAAIQQLEQLQHQWQSGECSNQNTAFRLAAILRLGLSLPQLTDNLPAHLASPEANSWMDIVKQLHHLRYNPNSNIHLDQQTFSNCRHWLNQTAKHQEQPPC